MKAGLLDRKVSFYSKTVSRDDFGAVKENYTLDFDTFGDITYAGGDMILSNDEKFFSGKMFLLVRFRNEISEKMWVQVDGVFYAITYMERIGRKEGLKITLQKINE